MSVLELFIEYASKFEKSVEDDQWERVYRFFHADSHYKVHSRYIACDIKGPKAIFAGMKKSLDGFDRLFETRKISLEGEIETTQTTVAMDWSAKYTLADHPQFTLLGRTKASYRDGLIETLEDFYTEDAEQQMQDWMNETGVTIKAAYA